MYPQPAIVVAWLMKSEIQPQTCVLVLTVATSQANLANNSNGFYTSSNQFGQSCYKYN